MRMSTKGRYGLRAVLQIAAEGGVPVSVRTIASRQDLSERYLEQLLRKLRANGVVASERGARGGYVLAKDARDITVADVLGAVGEPMEPVECVELQGRGSCPKGTVCGTKRAWQKLNQGVLDITRQMTIASLLDDADNTDMEKDDANGQANLS